MSEQHVEVIVSDEAESSVIEVLVPSNTDFPEDQTIEVQVTAPEPSEDIVEVDVPNSPGLSAYELAVNNGFLGSFLDYQESLRGPQGVQGNVGPQGPAGLDSNFVYMFYFASPSTTWYINHGLGTFAVNIELFDTQNTEWEAAIRYLDENNVVVEWYFPMSGFARLHS